MLPHAGDPRAEADASSGSDGEEEDVDDGDEVIHMEVDLEDDEGVVLPQKAALETVNMAILLVGSLLLNTT